MESNEKIAVGDTAVDFSLKDKNGKDCTLKQFRGKKVLLSFHPLDEETYPTG